MGKGELIWALMHWVGPRMDTDFPERVPGGHVKTQYDDQTARSGGRGGREPGCVPGAPIERFILEEDAKRFHTEALLRKAAAGGAHLELTEDDWDLVESQAVSGVNDALVRFAERPK